MICTEHYPDIFTPVPAKAPKEQAEAIKSQNIARKRVYQALRDSMQKHFFFDGDENTPDEPKNFPNNFSADEKVLFASVYGILTARNITDPSYGRQERGVPGPDDEYVRERGDSPILVVAQFREEVTQAVKDFSAHRDLYHAVFKVLFDEAAQRNPAGEPVETTVYLKQLADVTQRLADERVPASSPQIHTFVVMALQQTLGGGLADGVSSSIDVSLPDLDAGATIDILPANLHAIRAIYFSAMLEEMKLYAVTEKVAEHFVTGMLPLSRGPAGERIFEWIKGAPFRFNELERRSMYGRTLGLAQGAANEAMPNREFSDLWVRFLSTVAYFSRDQESAITKRTSSEQVHKSARDLAVNLSVHGYGVAHFAAVEMQKLVREMIAILSSSEVLAAYGVNDHWQLVERLSGMYLGGSTNGVRYRTMADSGAKVIEWLADHAALLSSSADGTNGEMFLENAATLSKKPRLVPLVERWLAVTGTQDTTVQKFSEPVDFRMQPTIPASPQIGGAAQQAVRNVLDRTGLGGLPNMGPVPQA